MDEAMCEKSSRPKRQQHQVISFQRRKELCRFAETIASMVLENTQMHERCLLRAMVEVLLPEE